MYKWDKEQLGTGKIGWELECKSAVEEVGIERIGIRKLEWIKKGPIGSRQKGLVYDYCRVRVIGKIEQWIDVFFGKICFGREYAKY